jgi:hypothetical protein
VTEEHILRGVFRGVSWMDRERNQNELSKSKKNMNPRGTIISRARD